MKVAYLVNQYPHVSHSFIRREIAALEAHGVAVARFSVRPAGRRRVVDPADRAERERPAVLLARRGWPAVADALARVVRAPGRWFARLRAGGAARPALGARRAAAPGLPRRGVPARCAGCAQRRRATCTPTSAPTRPTVALLARVLGGPPYSFTVHGPEEFDRPDAPRPRRQDRAARRSSSRSARSAAASSTAGASTRTGRRSSVVHCGLDAAVPRRASRAGAGRAAAGLRRPAVRAEGAAAAARGGGPAGGRGRRVRARARRRRRRCAARGRGRDRRLRARRPRPHHRLDQQRAGARRRSLAPRGAGPAELRRGAAGRADGGLRWAGRWSPPTSPASPSWCSRGERLAGPGRDPDALAVPAHA